MSKSINSYFKEYLRITPLSLALWRTLEADGMKDIKLVHPVLDIGCGFGEFSGVFFDGTVEVGIDINKKDLVRAGRKKKYKELIYADAKRLPFRDNSFNTIVSNSTLEHIDQADRVIKEVHRLLRKGGIFVFSVPTDEINNHLLGVRVLKRMHLNFLARKYVDIYHRIFKHKLILPKNIWEQYVTNCGLKLISCKSVMSKSQLEIFEKYLLFSLPTQITQKFFNRRVLFDNEIRVSYLYKNFTKYLQSEGEDYINAVFVAKKI